MMSNNTYVLIGGRRYGPGYLDRKRAAVHHPGPLNVCHEEYVEIIESTLTRYWRLECSHGYSRRSESCALSVDAIPLRMTVLGTSKAMEIDGSRSLMGPWKQDRAFHLKKSLGVSVLPLEEKGHLTKKSIMTLLKGTTGNKRKVYEDFLMRMLAKPGLSGSQDYGDCADSIPINVCARLKVGLVSAIAAKPLIVAGLDPECITHDPPAEIPLIEPFAGCIRCTMLRSIALKHQTSIDPVDILEGNTTGRSGAATTLAKVWFNYHGAEKRKEKEEKQENKSGQDTDEGIYPSSTGQLPETLPALPIPPIPPARDNTRQALTMPTQVQHQRIVNRKQPSQENKASEGLFLRTIDGLDVRVKMDKRLRRLKQYSFLCGG